MAEEVVPGFSVKYQAISTLGGAGYPTMLYWNVQLLVVGMLWIAGTRILFRKSKSYFALVDFYFMGFGLLLVSLDPWNVNPLLHEIGAISVAFFGAIAALLSSRIVRGYIRYFSVFLGTLSLFALFGNAWMSAVFGPGGAERVVYYPIFFWAILFGGVLIGKNPIPGVNRIQPEKVI